MKKDVNHIHDKSYKTLFSNKEIFLNLINDFTENDWKKELEPDSLILVDKSYILSDYEELESDIVYRAKVGDRELIFYILLEFQSSIDYSMPIRLLFYMIEIWRDVLKDISNENIKRKDFMLPAIIPIVAYNGEDNWYVPKNFKEKVRDYELFGANLLNFEYVLLDVNRYGKEELIDKRSIASAIFLLDQKVGVEEYMSRIAAIAKAFDRLTEKEKLELENWMKNTLQKEIADQAIEILDADKKEVDTMVANITKTIEEMKQEERKEGIKEGIREGIQEGIEEGIQEGKLEVARRLLLANVDIEIIISSTGIDREKLEKLKQEILE